MKWTEYLFDRDEETETGLSWKWWQEDSVELILMAFVVILFFAIPRQGCRGCGITPKQLDRQPQAASQGTAPEQADRENE